MMKRLNHRRFATVGLAGCGAIALTASGAIAQVGSQSLPQSVGQSIGQPSQSLAAPEFSPSEPVNPVSQVEQSEQSLLDDQGVLTPLEQAIVDEMNLARQNPGFYAELLMERRQHYNGLVFETPGFRLLTQEGVAAVDEAIAFLQAVEPVSPLDSSPGMSRAAADHAADLAPGYVGHVGTDGRLPSERLKDYGIWNGRMGENISFGSDTARDFVLELIIDDGVPSRGHRETLFQPDYAWTGVGCDQHAVYRTVCVMTYAVSYEDVTPATTAAATVPADLTEVLDQARTTAVSTSVPDAGTPGALPLPESRFGFGR